MVNNIYKYTLSIIKISSLTMLAQFKFKKKNTKKIKNKIKKKDYAVGQFKSFVIYLIK